MRFEEKISMEKQKKKKQKSRKAEEKGSRSRRAEESHAPPPKESEQDSPAGFPLLLSPEMPLLSSGASPFFRVPPLSSGCLFFPPRCLPFLPDTDCFSSADSLRCRSIYWCKSRKSKLCWQENYFFTKRKLSYRQQAYYSTGWSNREGRRFSPSAPRVKPFKMLI